MIVVQKCEEEEAAGESGQEPEDCPPNNDIKIEESLFRSNITKEIEDINKRP